MLATTESTMASAFLSPSKHEASLAACRQQVGLFAPPPSPVLPLMMPPRHHAILPPLYDLPPQQDPAVVEEPKRPSLADHLRDNNKGTSFFSSPSTTSSSSKTTSPPTIVGHRGAVYECLENTIEGFQVCGQAGLDIELDVFLLHDGTLLVFHGAGTDQCPGRLEEYCGVPGTILDMDYNKTQTLTFRTDYEEFPCPADKIRSASIPTLRQVLFALKDYPDTTVKIELKAGGPDLSKNTVELVRELEMQDQCCYSSFDHRRLDQVLEVEPNARTGALFAHPVPKDFVELCTGYTEIHLPYDACTQNAVNMIHKAGFGSMAWFRGPSGMQDDLQNKYSDASEEDCYATVAATGIQQICCNKPTVAAKLLLSQPPELPKQ